MKSPPPRPKQELSEIVTVRITKDLKKRILEEDENVARFMREATIEKIGRREKK